MYESSTRKLSASRSMKTSSAQLSSHLMNIEAKKVLDPVSVVMEVSKWEPPTLRRTRSVF